MNSSLFYEDWNNIQLLAEPGDWAMNINGKSAALYGGEIETRAALGGGFLLSVSGGYTHAKLNAGPHWQIVPNDKLTDVPPLTGDINLIYATEITEKYSLSAHRSCGPAWCR